MASLYPTAEEARITCAIVDAAAKVRDLNFKYPAEGKGATVTARFGRPDSNSRLYQLDPQSLAQRAGDAVEGG